MVLIVVSIAMNQGHFGYFSKTLDFRDHNNEIHSLRDEIFGQGAQWCCFRNQLL
jgi:hypothetical protein